MVQNYKVYFAQRPVIFTTEAPQGAQHEPFTELIRSTGRHDTVMIEQAIKRKARKIYVVAPEVDKAWRSFTEQFDFVQAAGGIISNSQDQLLFIYRKDKWDLPKGKVEEPESIESGALREVEEECGLTDVRIVSRLSDTWHTYVQEGEPVIKCTAWFHMIYEGIKKPKPQLIEGITEIRWLSWNETSMVSANTYPSVLDVLNELKAKQQSLLNLPHKS